MFAGSEDVDSEVESMVLWRQKAFGVEDFLSMVKSLHKFGGWKQDKLRGKLVETHKSIKDRGGVTRLDCLLGTLTFQSAVFIQFWFMVYGFDLFQSRSFVKRLGQFAAPFWLQRWWSMDSTMTPRWLPSEKFAWHWPRTWV